MSPKRLQKGPKLSPVLLFVSGTKTFYDIWVKWWEMLLIHFRGEGFPNWTYFIIMKLITIKQLSSSALKYRVAT